MDHRVGSIIDTQIAIKKIKDYFQTNLANQLNLTRVTCPRFVLANTGLNDNLNGVEMPVSFNSNGMNVEVVQSLAKWKRDALHKYNFKVGEGIYTDMDAIRKDEILDDIHSIYVDQWDWELIINETTSRSLNFLKFIVNKIYSVILLTENYVACLYPHLVPELPPNIFFISSEDLLKMFPNNTPIERENRICERYKAVFIIGIGNTLSDGSKHDSRAPDYDDWINCLNGDILVWNPILKRSFELSSMGIRVNKDSLIKQLTLTNNLDRCKLPWHQSLLNGELPQTIGGGIGQSRLCMYYLRKSHIGEVQCGVWPDSMISALKSKNIELL